MTDSTRAHEHRMSYGPIGEAVKEIGAIGEALDSEVIHIVVSHEHENGDKAHHHPAEVLTGTKQDTEDDPKPASKYKPGDLWQ
jgi:hypothetical protein